VFSSDGTRMFVIGDAGDDVNEYTLSTPFDASTRTFVDATSISAQEIAPWDIAFSSDGAKMFVIGNSGDDVNEYKLRVPFEASTRTFVGVTSIFEENTIPTDIAFSNDGAKMFVIDNQARSVNEYDLSSAYPIVVTGTYVPPSNGHRVLKRRHQDVRGRRYGRRRERVRPPTFVSSILGMATGSLAITFSDEIDAANVVPAKIHVRESGNYTHGVTLTVTELDTAADGIVISFTLNATHFEAVAAMTAPELTIDPGDGAKMFVIGNSGDDVNEYKLRVPFEASTRTFVGVTSIFEENTIPTDIAFSNDGAKMFVIDNQARSVNEYDLSSAYPIVVTGTYVPPPPTFASSILDMETGNLAITFLDEIDATPAANIVPAKIHVRESGTYTGGVTLTATELVTIADGTVISFGLCGTRMAA
jgi:hypothetical protein